MTVRLGGRCPGTAPFIPDRIPDRLARALARAALVVACAVLATACAGIVVEPSSTAAATGPTKFWGYASGPGIEIDLQAQNTGGTWEFVQSTTATARATYASGHQGYYWELTTNPKTIANRFRRPASGSYTVFYQITSPGLSPAQTHNQTPGAATTGDFEQLWAAFQSDGIIRLNVF